MTRLASCDQSSSHQVDNAWNLKLRAWRLNRAATGDLVGGLGLPDWWKFHGWAWAGRAFGCLSSFWMRIWPSDACLVCSCLSGPRM